MGLGRTLVLLTLFPLPGLVHAADGLLYVADSANRLLTVDVATGQALRIGTTGAQFTDIAFGPAGRLYGITPAYLYEIDPTTGWSTLIGPHNYGGSPNAFGLDALTFGRHGGLYAAGNDILVSINPTTGAGTTVGSLSGHRSAGDLALDSAGRLLLATDTGMLVEVHADGSGATPVGPLPFTDVFVLAGDADGGLYGIRGTNEVLSVDPHTGQAAIIGTLHGDFLLGRAWGGSFPGQHLPGPPTILLIGASIPFLTARRRQRTRP